jgi:hypothetical protein
MKRHIKKMDDSGHLLAIPGRSLIPEGKEDGYIYPIYLTPSELETPVLRYSDNHLQELLQKPHHIQLMELQG